jgi:1-aminocyclopropane-1-carboxylate deaminase/D-cysteine desulfhydrase-like pyridoxal-dependent ACC family enzyme
MTRDLNKKIEQESEKLKNLQEKRAELDQKIKKSESILERYYLMKNSEQYEAIQRATENTGLSIDDILSALKSGDMLGLQERMEAKTKENQQ